VAPPGAALASPVKVGAESLASGGGSAARGALDSGDSVPAAASASTGFGGEI
jgi:hypothetical protein